MCETDMLNEYNPDHFGGKFYQSQFQQGYLAASANRFKHNNTKKKTK